MIIEGYSAIDESMITGESNPVEKKKVMRRSALLLIRQGALSFRQQRLGSETALAQIIKMVQEAQGSKPPIAKGFCRCYCKLFCPCCYHYFSNNIYCMVYIWPRAIFTYALLNFVAVLIIACPCASWPSNTNIRNGRHWKGRNKRYTSFAAARLL